jgi:ketosteroid isomerase-like protein
MTHRSAGSPGLEDAHGFGSVRDHGDAGQPVRGDLGEGHRPALVFYSPDIVYFDIVPPLRYTGSAALRDRFLNWFDGFEGPIGQDIHDLSILASGDIATTFMLIRASGTLKNGPAVERWVRASSGCQQSDHGWLIVHEHVSVPVDLETGSVAVGLAP